MLNQVEGVTNPFKFADGYLDASGYYQFGERYYDPSLGRWTQQDPVGGSLGGLNAANRYTYADDDPVNVTDPSGHLTCQQALAAFWLTTAGAALGTLFSIVTLGVALAAGLSG